MITRALQLARVAREHALDLLFIKLCLTCQVELPLAHSGIPICDECISKIPPIDWPTCSRCAAAVPPYPGDTASCPRCESDRLRFDSALSLGQYEGLLKELVLRMKADRREQIGQVLAALMWERLGTSLEHLNVDAIVPIPISIWGFLTRRTCPPAVIARYIGRALKVPVFGRLLIRGNDLSPQHILSRAGRFRNVRGGYRVRKGFRLDGPHILLVDDVMTTGATCSEVARILKRQGAARVSVLVAARTPNA